MGRFREIKVSDEQAERLLSPNGGAVGAGSPLGAVVRELRDAGQTPPSEAIAAQHLTAILAEVRSPRDTVLAAPRQRRRLVPPRLAAGATAFAAMAALAVAGALPGPVQAAASDVLGVVGINLPDGRDAPATERAPAPSRPAAAPAETAPPATDEQDEPARPAEAPDDDQRRSGNAGPGGDGSGTAGGREDDRDRSDDGGRGSRDDERVDRDEDNDGRGPGSDRGSDDEEVGDEPESSDGSGREDDDTDNSGSGSARPESEDSDGSDGSGSDDLDEDSEGRSEPDAEAVPESGDELDPIDD